VIQPLDCKAHEPVLGTLILDLCLWPSPWQVCTNRDLARSAKVAFLPGEASAALMTEFRNVLTAAARSGERASAVTLYDTAGDMIPQGAPDSLENGRLAVIHLKQGGLSATAMKTGATVAWLSVLYCEDSTAEMMDPESNEGQEGGEGEEGGEKEETRPALRPDQYSVDANYDLAMRLQSLDTVGGSAVLHLNLVATREMEEPTEEGAEDEGQGPTVLDADANTSNIPNAQCWRTLTPPEEASISSALGAGDGNEVLTRLGNIWLRRYDMRTLRPRKWLNDEVMNMFIKLLEALRDAQHIYLASTAFYARLKPGGPSGNYTFANVQRWTKNHNIQTLKMVLVPIHIFWYGQGAQHWVVAAVDLEQLVFEYYDSLRGGDGEDIFLTLKRWLVDVGAVSKANISRLQYKEGHGPQQRNGFDCGIFVAYYAFCRVARRPIDFDQGLTHYLRRLMVLQLLCKK
jgi:sentrin-specific protease 1